ncbi:MAG: hypothetical protein WBQ75_20310 [Acetobacteraceae bacterium]
MPQPVRPLIAADFSPRSMLARPELAAHIGVISAIWNEIDKRIATLLAALIGAEARVVIGMYQSLTSAPAQRAALSAAASLRMTSDQTKMLEIHMKEIRKRGRERHAVVHGTWGVSDHHSDALIWADPKDRIVHEINRIDDARAIKQNGRSTHYDILAGIREEQTKWMVYKAEDFKDIEDRMTLALIGFAEFSSSFLIAWIRH